MIFLLDYSRLMERFGTNLLQHYSTDHTQQKMCFIWFVNVLLVKGAISSGVASASMLSKALAVRGAAEISSNVNAYPETFFFRVQTENSLSRIADTLEQCRFRS